MRLIDADALIKRLAYCVKQGMGAAIAFTFMHMIDEAPTINADRPKGEWEEMRNWRNGSFYSRCSECGYFDDERDDLTAYNYCPNCGADMRGEDNE